ncbi:hypothetical protein [Nocardia sp. NRRL S-836]|uniref:hypothetical protein n=1 Tax=Nocardia sp. NRRL S-836 TaxID=1519492 RepID=UPI0006ADD8AC|nr:hypothetical protein [Nocardia sp. NRRL S-836]KOV84632.1 hypothetical protein ADL03_15160 [Nocardia sp. NRRL S-836]
MIEEPADGRDAKLGIPWRIAIAAMPEDTGEELESFAAHWIPHHRQLTIDITSEGTLRRSVSPDDGQATPDLASANESLVELGSQRFRDWTSPDAISRLWAPVVHQAPEI